MTRSLYIMCHIPVFCWITATVLQDILIKNSEENISTTLTEMYIHFLLIQMKMKNQKYDGKAKRQRTKLLYSNSEMILKLAKLAFEQLKQENIVFYEKDLKACGIDVCEDTEVTGMIVRFLAGRWTSWDKGVLLCAFECSEFLLQCMYSSVTWTRTCRSFNFFFDKPKENITLQELLQKAVNKAMKSRRGHLDMFLRFLMGVTLESSQNLLQGLITHTEDTTESITQQLNTLKKTRQVLYSRWSFSQPILLLTWAQDHSLYEEIQRYLSSDATSRKRPLIFNVHRADLHTADVRESSEWVQPKEVHVIKSRLYKTGSSCEMLQKSPVSNFTDCCLTKYFILHQLSKYYVKYLVILIMKGKISYCRNTEHQRLIRINLLFWQIWQLWSWWNMLWNYIFSSPIIRLSSDRAGPR